MDEYASTSPDAIETRETPGEELSNKERLRREIEQIERQLERKVSDATKAIQETAEADRRDLERAQEKLNRIRETVKAGWDNVTESAASALLKLLK